MDFDKKIKSLIDYYKENGLLIVGLNDSQGVNTTTTFFKKGLLDYLALALTSDELSPEVINAFSLTMNKTEHIDYFLESNLSLEEIKLSQVYSAVSALEKVMSDIGLPKFLGGIGNVYRLIYKIKSGDDKIRISSSLDEAVEPVLIYSSGVNDLMREVGANPFGIKSDYKNRAERPNYYYTLDKVKDKRTLPKVMDSIERNFNNIKDINNTTDIYTLGAYIPKSLESEEMNIFRDLVIQYNEALRELCKSYGITFINTEEVGKTYNKSVVNFHLTSAGHNAIACSIIDAMYRNKIVNPISKPLNQGSFSFRTLGAERVIDATLDDCFECIKKADSLSSYARTRELEIAKEHHREAEVMEKVLNYTFQRRLV